MAVVTKIDMDNGSFPIAKDSLRTLAKTKISGAHRAIIDVIWMETYGWYDEKSSHEDKLKRRKTVAQIPHDVFVNETWMDKSTVSRRLNDLVKWGIVIRDKNTSPFSYSFNVHVANWSPEVFRETKVAKPVNSLTTSQQLTGLQDGKQFNNLSTNSLTTCQPTVDRIVNCCQAQTQSHQALQPPLNNIKEIYKESTTPLPPPRGNCGVGVLKDDEKKNDEITNEDVYDFYQNNFGTISSFMAEKIDCMCEDIGSAMVIEAMKIAVTNGARRLNYVESIINRWLAVNIRSPADITRDREEWKQKASGGNNFRNAKNISKPPDAAQLQKQFKEVLGC